MVKGLTVLESVLRQADQPLASNSQCYASVNLLFLFLFYFFIIIVIIQVFDASSSFFYFCLLGTLKIALLDS